MWKREYMRVCLGESGIDEATRLGKDVHDESIQDYS